MTIIVETGAEVTSANSYASYAELVAYGLIRGITVTATQSAGEVFLIEAMDMLELRKWKGERVTTTQALAWPRSGVVVDGQTVEYNEIPRELKYGQLALALTAHQGTTLMPTQTAMAKGPVIEERVEGAVTVKYANSGSVLSVAADATADALLRVLEINSGLNVVRA